MDASRIPHTRFIESFDPVRFPDSKADLNNVHARLDLLIQSILFGEQMIVPEPYSFDSVGFLRIASDLLRARPEPNAMRVKSPAWNPFLLVLREQSGGSYRSMIATQLRNPRFILSGWSSVSKVEKDRESIAASVASGDWSEAAQPLHGEYVEQLDRVADLDAYFSTLQLPTAGPPEIPLPDYLDWLEAADFSGQQDEITEDVRRLQESVRVLKAAGVDLNNRSEVRIRGRHLLPEADYDGIVEFIDSSYSEVVHSSTRGTSVILSTPLVHPSERQVFSGQELSTRAHHQNLRNLGKVGTSRSQRVALKVEDGIEYQEFLSPSALWDIVTDEEWVRSAQRLREAASLPEPVRADRLVRAREAHIDVLAPMLAEWNIRNEGGWFTANPGNGVSYGTEEGGFTPGSGEDQTITAIAREAVADLARGELSAGYTRTLAQVSNAAANG